MKKALVLALTFVFGLSIAAFAVAPLSGSWCTDMVFAIDQTGSITVDDFSSTLIVDYTVCGWVFESETKFDLTGWTAQSFSADGVLGAFSIGSDLVFSPATAAFTSWDSTVGVSIAGVAFDGEFLLTDVGAGWTFGASGGAGACDFGATVYFNMDTKGNLQTDGYCFCFSSIELTTSFPFCCVELVDVTIGFSNTGFDGVTFAVTGIAVPALPWLSFDVALTFDDGALGKEMTLTPVFDLGDFVCITLYYDFVGDGATSCQTPSGATITGLYFYGIGLDCEFGGVSFSSVSSFDPDENEDLTGYAEYWEVFTISSAADACCGGAFDFSVSNYFACTSDMLFDWAMTSIEVGIGMGSNFDITLGLDIDTTGFNKLSFGFCVTW